MTENVCSSSMILDLQTLLSIYDTDFIAVKRNLCFVFHSIFADKRTL